jgi:hypothetical protein
MLSPHETKSATQGTFVYSLMSMRTTNGHAQPGRRSSTRHAKILGRTYTVHDINGHPWFFTKPPADR